METPAYKDSFNKKNNYELAEKVYNRSNLLNNVSFSSIPYGQSRPKEKDVVVVSNFLYPEDKIIKIDDFYFNIENNNDALKITEVRYDGKLLNSF